jgi:hypothetical protein
MTIPRHHRIVVACALHIAFAFWMAFFGRGLATGRGRRAVDDDRPGWSFISDMMMRDRQWTSVVFGTLLASHAVAAGVLFPSMYDVVRKTTRRCPRVLASCTLASFALSSYFFFLSTALLEPNSLHTVLTNVALYLLYPVMLVYTRAAAVGAATHPMTTRKSDTRECVQRFSTS